MKKRIRFIGFAISLLFGFCTICACFRNKDKNTLHDTGPVWRSDTTDLTITPSLSYLMGKFEPSEDTNFVEIKKVHADRPGLYLRKEVYSAFEQMFEAAQNEGIRLQIRSATRNFDHQKRIWENKWNGIISLESGISGTAIAGGRQRALEILKYSSMPGSSRHHWGTDIDLNAFNNSYFSEGEGLRIYTWLREKASTFGFCQPYTAKGASRPYGYEEEKWHWSFMPISLSYTSFAMNTLEDSMIVGFAGSEYADTIDIVDRYVLGIDSTCINKLHPDIH